MKFWVQRLAHLDYYQTWLPLRAKKCPGEQRSMNGSPCVKQKASKHSPEESRQNHSSFQRCDAGEMSTSD
ncbi:hypothetical protein NDU88_001171 [Pleurodeles waltl]|uniref:Uncharacterized protein n=1 Tax=Pleurodeles waltl TaxID=8319 RepID=A0AAV7TIF1_PLEWA|nr:hypothetical protein NDU88_001171 [Pleurodeles waltl]